MDTRIILSILILSLPSRMTTFLHRLLQKLKPQIEKIKGVEIILLIDNKDLTVGEKRNETLEMANGEYVVWIDDDDLVSEDYVSSIMDRIQTAGPNIDCIVFDSLVTINGGIQQHCKYGIELEYNNAPPPELWTGKPAHTMVWRRKLINNIYFPHEDFGEDTTWVKHSWPLIRSQERIDKILYYYEFNEKTSETR